MAAALKPQKPFRLVSTAVQAGRKAMDKLVAPWKPACDFHYERVRVAIHHGSRKRRCAWPGNTVLQVNCLRPRRKASAMRHRCAASKTQGVRLIPRRSKFST